MPVLRLLTTAILASALCSFVNAQSAESSHRVAATKFHDANQYPDASYPVKQLAEHLMLGTQAQPELRPEFERLASELLSSPEVRESRILAYMRIFSEQELRLLLDLVQHPGFQLYIGKAAELRSVSGDALVEAMAAKREDLENRYRHLFKPPTTK